MVALGLKGRLGVTGIHLGIRRGYPDVMKRSNPDRWCYGMCLPLARWTNLAVAVLVIAFVGLHTGAPRAGAGDVADDAFVGQQVNPAIEAAIEQAVADCVRLTEQLDSSAAFERLDTNLRPRVAIVARVCGLADVQRRKLQLASRGDVKQYFDHIAEVATRFQAINSDPDKVDELLKLVDELRKQAQLLERSDFKLDLWNDTSLFARCLRATVTAEQFARWVRLRPVVLAGGSIQTSRSGPDEEMEIILTGTAFADEELTTLGDLPSLRTLFLSNTRITDAGLAAVLSGLKHLLLDNTQVSDEGLMHLKKLSKLKWLDLSNTTVTDGGLSQLKDLTGLRLLYLANTQVTDSGVEQLQRVLPGVTVKR